MSWRLGLSTGIGYQHPIEAVLEPIRAAGFRSIEVATARSHLDLGDTGRIARLAESTRRLELEVHSLHAPFGPDIDPTDDDAAVRSRTLAIHTAAADVLRALGGRLLVVHPGGEDNRWVWERDARLARSVEGLSRLWEVCRDRQLTLVVETALPHLLGGRLDDLSWILGQLPHEGTGVCVDTSHCSLGGFLFEAIERFAGRLVHVQASDNHGVTDDHLPPGDGRIDWTRVLSALERAGYQGRFLLEVAGNGDVHAHVRRVAERVRAALPDLGRELRSQT
jgi:sugar phosphate isomerase/epimerase